MKDRWPHGPAIFGSQSRWPLDPASTVLNWEAASGRLFFSATGILDVACWHIASVIAAQRNVRSWMQAGSDRHVAKEFVVPAKAGIQTTRRCRDCGSRLNARMTAELWRDPHLASRNLLVIPDSGATPTGPRKRGRMASNYATAHRRISCGNFWIPGSR